MYNGKAAEGELKSLAGGSYMENDLIRHNLVVFRGGESALQVNEGSGIGESAQRGGEKAHCSIERAGPGALNQTLPTSSSSPL